MNRDRKITRQPCTLIITCVTLVLGTVRVNLATTESTDGGQQKGNLFCYVCYKNINGDICMKNVSNIDIKQCKDEEIYCKISRLTLEGDVLTFTRTCAKECQAGCEVAGTVRKSKLCISCCSNHLCNVGNGAAKTYQITSFLVVTSVSAYIWFYLS